MRKKEIIKKVLLESDRHLSIRKKIFKESISIGEPELRGIKILRWEFNPNDNNFSFKCGKPNILHSQAPIKIKICFPIQQENNFLSEYNYSIDRELKNTPKQFINSSQNLSDLFQTDHFLSALKYHIVNQ